MNHLVALDPGINRSGVAEFANGQLVRAFCVSVAAKDFPIGIVGLGMRAKYMAGRIHSVGGFPIGTKVIAEWPQIYQREKGKSKGDPNKMLPLAAVIGAVVARHFIDGVQLIQPHEWKGQASKPAMKRRIVERLTPTELARIPVKLVHDGWDAIGIGLHGLGRLERKRVFPGAT